MSDQPFTLDDLIRLHDELLGPKPEPSFPTVDALIESQSADHVTWLGHLPSVEAAALRGEPYRPDAWFCHACGQTAGTEAHPVHECPASPAERMAATAAMSAWRSGV